MKHLSLKAALESDAKHKQAARELLDLVIDARGWLDTMEQALASMGGGERANSVLHTAAALRRDLNQRYSEMYERSIKGLR